VWASIGLLVVSLAVTVPVYGGWFSGNAQAVYKFGLPLLWGGLALATAGRERLASLRVVLLSLLGVSLGFALAYLVGGRPLERLGLSETTPQGAAAAKILSEVVPICAAILLVMLPARVSLASLGLRGGRVRLGLWLGLLASVPIVALALLDPSGGGKAVLAVPPRTLLAWLPWIAAFSIGNGFMEEVWFRGAWFAAFRRVLGPSAAMHVTSLAFGISHVIVYWRDPTAVLILTPVWLYMGYAFAAIVRKTDSLWGVTLAHAIADIIYMYIVFARA
jgi:membrane protease YdiL (CAAX protease family)